MVFRSEVQLWQVPRNVYRMMPVSHAELWTRVRPYGKIGRYLAEQVVAFNNEWLQRPGKHRPIRVYKNIDARFILEDLYAKLELAANS